MSATKQAGGAALSVFLASSLASLPAVAQAPYDAPPVQQPQGPPAGQAPAGQPPAGQPAPPPEVPAPWVPVAPMAPPVAPVPAPMAPAAPMPGVYVELRADSVGVRISEVVGENWVPVCYVPCRRVLPRNRIYVIEGSGIKATTRFMLPDDRAQLTLDVQAGSRVQQMGGAVLMAAGLATSYVALVFEGSSTASMSGSSNRSDTAGLFALGGLAAAALGLVLVVSAQTKVQSSSGASFSEASPGRPRRAPRPAVALTARGLEF